MGYSLTVVSITRVQKYLDEMVSSKTDVTWRTSEQKFSYYLREGIKAAKWLVTEASLKNTEVERSYYNYASLDQKFKIRIRPGLVVAELRSGGSGVPEDVVTVINEATDLYQVVGAIVEHKASKMQFPNAVIPEENMKKLQAFVITKDYSITETNPLTVSKK